MANQQEKKDESYQNKNTIFIYKKIYTIINNFYCSQLTLNTNSTILFIGKNNGSIRLYGFNNRGKLIQTLYYTCWPIICLIWMKKTNQLISGSYDQSIIIWKLDQNNQLSEFQNLQINNELLHCMILNDDEDLLVIIFLDCQIQIWKKEVQTWICLLIKETQSSVFTFSLSDSGQNLIMFGQHEQEFVIELIEYENDENWRFSQMIKLDEYGEGLCIINDNCFAYQSCNKDFLEIYHYAQLEKKIIKVQQVQVQSSKSSEKIQSFSNPSQFIKEKKILLVKHGAHINFFGIDSQQSLFLKQSIEFESKFGRHFQFKHSRDGQYLITWNNETYKYTSPINSKNLWNCEIGKILYQND